MFLSNMAAVPCHVLLFYPEQNNIIAFGLPRCRYYVYVYFVIHIVTNLCMLNNCSQLHYMTSTNRRRKRKKKALAVIVDHQLQGPQRHLPKALKLNLPRQRLKSQMLSIKGWLVSKRVTASTSKHLFVYVYVCKREHIAARAAL